MNAVHGPAASSWPKSVAVVSAVGAAAILAYLMWLGWHAPLVMENSITYSDPHTAGEFLRLAATLVLLVAVAAYFLDPTQVAWGAAGGVLLIYLADTAASAREGDNSFWLLGVVAWALIALPAAFVVASFSAGFRARQLRSSRSS